jgi:hypothetical protein
MIDICRIDSRGDIEGMLRLKLATRDGVVLVGLGVNPMASENVL